MSPRLFVTVRPSFAISTSPVEMDLPSVSVSLGHELVSR